MNALRTQAARTRNEDASFTICCRFGKDDDVHLLIALMLIKHIPPARVGYWKENGSESDFMLVGTLESGEHDRVCGWVSRGDTGWDVITLRSGGAMKGLDLTADSFDVAKSKVEQDCH